MSGTFFPPVSPERKDLHHCMSIFCKLDASKIKNDLFEEPGLCFQTLLTSPPSVV